MPGSSAAQTLEGLWWTRDSGIGGFVALSNAAAEPRTVSIEALTRSGQTLPVHSFTLASHSTQMLDLLSLIGQQPAAGDAGGIRIQYGGLLGEVNVTGGLENRQEGYSAIIPFWQTPIADMNMSTSTVTVAHPGIMIGAADPMMGFPAGTRFTPYLALRNLTAGVEQVSLILYTEQGTSLAAPTQSLQPFESRQVDMKGVLQQLGLKDFAGELTFAVSHSGNAGDVMSAAGSVDAKGTYVFEVDGRAAEQKLSKGSPYWSVKNGNDAMVALWNPSGTAEDVMVTVTYAHRSGVYHFRLHLAAHATANLDMKELIANQSRDEDGNILPLDVQEGSFIFHNAKDVHEPLSLNVNVGIYNVAKGTCYYGSVYCDGYYGGLIVSPATSSIAAAGNWIEGLSAYGQYSDGSTPGVGAAWSSSNNGVATVDSNGNVAGVNAGNATVTATANLPEEGEYSGYNPSCSSLQPYVNYTGTANVAVGDLTPVITGISPSDWIAGTTASVTFSDKDATWWDYLAAQAEEAVNSDAPSVVDYDADGKVMPGLSPKFLAWAKVHSLDSREALRKTELDLAAVAFVGESRDPRAIPLLRLALLSPNYLVEMAAARGLAQLQDKASIPLIVQACEGAPAEAVFGIASGLLDFHTPKAQIAAKRFMPGANRN